MASCTDVTRKRRKIRHKNMGHQRKVRQARHSTLSYNELFAALGEPGKPAPQAAAPAK